MQSGEDWALDTVQHFALLTLQSLKKQLDALCGRECSSERPDADKLYKALKDGIADMHDGPEKEEKVMFINEMETKLRSDEFAQEVRAQFERQDVDNSGALDITEFAPLAAEMVQMVIEDEATPADIENAFHSFDADNNGTIDVNEYVAFVVVAILTMYKTNLNM
eukprot:TRINITY_DN13289_c0_g1_i1.p1 TRINITY_DN13289_c0_g1~~TRINITY_DN13289_c0_g1_i1.p1  ORF type:complete len:165 (+),score=47.79 TRINITY_DN13289_c0_g1_i1:261-755(+)